MHDSCAQNTIMLHSTFIIIRMRLFWANSLYNDAAMNVKIGVLI